MANKHRGEVDIEIADKTYAVAMTLGAMAEIASALGIETMEEMQARVPEMRMPDLVPVLRAVLKGNGHDVPDADLMAINWRTYVEFILALWNARPGSAEPDKAAKPVPQKRAS